MFGKPPFSIADNCVVEVRNLAAASEWYRETLGFHEADTDREEDSGRPFTDLCISNDDTLLEPGASPEKGHVVFYAKSGEGTSLVDSTRSGGRANHVRLRWKQVV